MSIAPTREEREFSRGYNQASETAGAVIDHLSAKIECLRAALQEIADMPFSMVNDSESLRHSLRTIQQIALKALSAVQAHLALRRKDRVLP